MVYDTAKVTGIIVETLQGVNFRILSSERQVSGNTPKILEKRRYHNTNILLALIVLKVAAKDPNEIGAPTNSETTKQF